MQIDVASAAALRCGLGGRVSISSEVYYAVLRGARLPELSALIRTPHKKLPEQVGRAMPGGEWQARCASRCGMRTMQADECLICTMRARHALSSGHGSILQVRSYGAGVGANTRTSASYQKTDPHLRYYRAQREEGPHLCVHIQLEGGRQLVRVAGGLGVRLGD